MDVFCYPLLVVAKLEARVHPVSTLLLWRRERPWALVRPY